MSCTDEKTLEKLGKVAKSIFADLSKRHVKLLTDQHGFSEEGLFIADAMYRGNSDSYNNVLRRLPVLSAALSTIQSEVLKVSNSTRRDILVKFAKSMKFDDEYMYDTSKLKPVIQTRLKSVFDGIDVSDEVIEQFANELVKLDLSQIESIPSIMAYGMTTNMCKLPKDVMLYRGFINTGESLTKGDILQDSALLSTSTNPAITFQFASHEYRPWDDDEEDAAVDDFKNEDSLGWVMRIGAKKNQSARALSLGSDYEDECEVLLPRNTKLRIIEVDEFRHIVTCEIVED